MTRLVLLALLMAGCGGGDHGDADCIRNTQDRSTREQAQWVERCPAPQPSAGV